MILDLLKKYKVVIIVIAVIIVILLLISIVLNTIIFRVSNTVPSNNTKINTGTNLITIEFNKDIQNIDNNSVVSESNIIRSVSVDKNKLSIGVNNLQNNRKYQIIINNIKSTDNQIIDKYVYNFETGFVPESQMSEAERNQAIQQTDKGNTQDPIIKVLPYNTPSYTVNYRFVVVGDEETKTVIDVVIYLNEVDRRAGEIESVNFYKKQINDYLIKNGIDINNYQFNYTVK